MKTLSIITLAGLCALAGGGCSTGTHIVVATGTTIGMKATPGDGETQPPQLTVGYKRAEGIMIPTGSTGSTKAAGAARGKDTYSTLTGIGYRTGITTATSLKQVIATGFAADAVVTNTNFINAAKQTAPPP